MDHEGFFLVGGIVSWMLLQSISTVKKRDARYKDGFRILKSSPKTIFIDCFRLACWFFAEFIRC